MDKEDNPLRTHTYHHIHDKEYFPSLSLQTGPTNMNKDLPLQINSTLVVGTWKNSLDLTIKIRWGSHRNKVIILLE